MSKCIWKICYYYRWIIQHVSLTLLESREYNYEMSSSGIGYAEFVWNFYWVALLENIPKISHNFGRFFLCGIIFDNFYFQLYLRVWQSLAENKSLNLQIFVIWSGFLTHENVEKLERMLLGFLAKRVVQNTGENSSDCSHNLFGGGLHTQCKDLRVKIMFVGLLQNQKFENNLKNCFTSTHARCWIDQRPNIFNTYSLKTKKI